MIYTLILFVLLQNSTQASVRVGFDSMDTCVAAAKTVADNLKQSTPGADVVWSCVRK